VTVSIDEVLSGSLKGDGSTISIAEIPTVELSPTPSGAHGFFFLPYEKEDGDLIINPEGRFLVNEAVRLDSSELDADPWVKEIEMTTPEEFGQVVRAVSAEATA
jgi:hypothetical protein